MAMMQTKGLYKSLLGTEEQLTKPAPLANGASNDEKKNHKVLKDAYEKEVADIKEKRNNVCCHLALIPDAKTFMLMRHDCVGDVGIGDRAKAWNFLQERFQSVETPTVVTLVAQLARLQLKDVEDLDGFFMRGQELLTRLQEARGSSLRDPLQSLGAQCSANEVLKFCYTGMLYSGNEFHRVEENAAELP